jgi:hypothetical protein
MGQVRCNDCHQVIFTAEGVNAGRISLPCPNRQCPSRRQRPVKQQRYQFDPKQRTNK